MVPIPGPEDYSDSHACLIYLPNGQLQFALHGAALEADTGRVCHLAGSRKIAFPVMIPNFGTLIPPPRLNCAKYGSIA